jgi:hypothetical protein
MSGIAKSKVIRYQNSPTFEINLGDQPIIFRKRILSKVLNLPQTDISKPRTVIVRCLVPSCRYVFISSLITNLILILL